MTEDFLPDLHAKDPEANIHRLLPQSQDAELAVLSSMLLSPDEVVPMVIDKRITKGHFHVGAHGIVFDVIVDLYDHASAIDFIIVTQILRNMGNLEKVGGPAFVTNLFTFVPTAANAAYYIEILREKHTLRQIIVTCNEFSSKSYEEHENVDSFLDHLESRVGIIGQDRLSAARFSMKSVTMDALQSIEKLYERQGSISGLSTGFIDLDRITDGLHPAEMIVIAARPSMGKTALAMNIAENVGIDQDVPVGVFSLEMSTKQLAQRIICCRAKVNMQNIQAGMLSERDFQNLTTSASKLAESKILIDDTAGLTILELRARARKWKQEKDIQLIVIDYLQLLKSTSKRGQENRQLEVSEISSGIKGLAKELEIPIIVLAQLNRNPEGRPGGKPRLSDLRESGSIEQDADIVGLLHRGEYYAKEDEEKEQLSGEADLMIVKQRNGPLEDIPLTFLKQFTRFETRAKFKN